MTALAACTIVSKNYLAYARVLATSFREHHPEGRFFVLLVDRNEGKIEAAAEPFELVEAEELENVADLERFLFKYTLLEANTAIKPFFMAHLIERHALANLVYFDPDILITASLRTLAELVDRHAVVLTPHLTDPIDDDAYPNEQAILMAGSFNLGFIAVRACDTSHALLRWWQRRLYDKCLVRISEALFVDQKWMDLAPGLFKDVYVLHDPGYNVAYWNLHGRRVTLDADGAPSVNGRPLVFFHFSGIQPQSLEGVSKYQDRFRLSEIGDAAELYRLYAAKVLAAGDAECKPWPYFFGRFDNGVPIPDAARSLYHGLGEAEKQRFGNPFATGPGSFFEWLKAPERGAAKGAPYLSRLFYHFYSRRPDLQAAYPDPLGEHFAGFSAWLMEAGRYELKLHEVWLEAVLKPKAGDLLEGGLRRRMVHRLKRLYHSPFGQKAKAALRKALGPERTRALKRKLRPGGGEAALPSVAEPLLSLEGLGVNLIGYLKAETGMGEAARMLGLALEAAGVPVARHHLELGVVARQDDDRAGESSDHFPHGINLLVVNADQLPLVVRHLGPAVTAGRYQIGYWLWEQEDFPDALVPSFTLLDELWTPTTFCQEAFSRKAPIPVRCVPFPVEAPQADRGIRGELGLPSAAFLVLYLFNYLSYAERKNPLGAVEAFRRAFGDDDRYLLLLKTSSKDFAPDEHQRLLDAIGKSGNIRLIDRYLSRRQISALIGGCDSYLSLHRAEGFGLTLAEAMALGKPVIATPYSGPRDFFDLNNGLPVRYQRVELAEDHGPYPRGSHWAEPDVQHAAEQLRRAAAGGLEGLGARARQDIAERYGVEAIGRRVARLLGELAIRHGKVRRPPH